MLDSTSRIRFGSVLPKKSWIILCKTCLTSDPDPDDLVRFWPNATGPEATRCACRNHGARFWQNTSDPLPVSRFRTRLCQFFHRRPGSCCAKPPPLPPTTPTTTGTNNNNNSNAIITATYNNTSNNSKEKKRTTRRIVVMSHR